jgi:hypothetical protein
MNFVDMSHGAAVLGVHRAMADTAFSSGDLVNRVVQGTRLLGSVVKAIVGEWNSNWGRESSYSGLYCAVRVSESEQDPLYANVFCMSSFFSAKLHPLALLKYCQYVGLQLCSSPRYFGSCRLITHEHEVNKLTRVRARVRVSWRQGVTIHPQYYM